MSTMLGALNRFISRLDSESPSQSSRDRSAYGFQVLRNKNLEIHIEPWYDFVIGIKYVCSYSTLNQPSADFYTVVDKSYVEKLHNQWPHSDPLDRIIPIPTFSQQKFATAPAQAST